MFSTPAATMGRGGGGEEAVARAGGARGARHAVSSQPPAEPAPMGSKRLPMVPALSSAARMPLPAVAMALAVAMSSAAKGVAAIFGG